MKSERINKLVSAYEWVDKETNTKAIYTSRIPEIVQLAEQEAEERMRKKAIEAFCVDCICASDGKHCSLRDECALKVHFIQKLTEE